MGIRDKLKRFFLPWTQDSMLFEVTARCNQRCNHCYNVWKDDVGYGEEELPTEKALALIRKAVRESRCTQFTFTGGEPLLRDDLEELVSLAHAMSQYVVLITNGTLLNEERIRSLHRAGVDLFELPLNGGNRDLHDEMAGFPGAFDCVTRAAADIRVQGAQLAFVFVGTSKNMDRWKETLELGIALGAQGFLFNRYNAGGECHGRPERLMPSVEQVRHGLAVAEEYARKYGVGIGASIAIPPCLIDPSEFPNVGFGFCAAGTSQAYYTIDPIGNLRPCNHTPTILGNLFHTSLQSLAESKTMTAFRAARPDFCRGCGLEEECLGGCKAAAEACYGSLCACEPFLELNKDRAQKLPRSDGSSF